MRRKWFLTFLVTALIVSALNIFMGLVLLRVETKEAVFVGLFAGIGTGIAVAYGLSHHQHS